MLAICALEREREIQACDKNTLKINETRPAGMTLPLLEVEQFC